MELCFRFLAVVLFYIAACAAEYTDPHCGGKQVIVHLFEWKWTDVALECERFLSKKGFCGVQVSPANEHVVVMSPPRPWWERYQPVSYKLQSRSGTEDEFIAMVRRCKAVGVRIYVDVVINHMAGLNRNGTGSAGSYFNSDEYNFTGVPYTKEHFNPYCELNSYNDEHLIKDCYLLGLTDLDQKNTYVRDTLTDFLNELIDIGVAGFRVDAAKHMWVSDLEAIEQRLIDLPEGGRPFFYHEVIDQSNGPVTSQQYTSLGYVTEFRYCQKLKEGIEDFGRLNDVVDYNWGMTDSHHAFVFVDNHDNERGHGGGGSIITFEQPKEYKMAVAFLMANDYGFARVMSSYYFGDNSDLGPPHYANYTTKTVPVGADETSCGNDWVCEHRWRPVANMVAFRNAVVGTSKENYYNQNNQIAFSRGHVGFFAMARDGHMDLVLQTGLPAGEYCDLITECAKTVIVGGNGEAHIVIDNPEEPVLAIIVGNTVGLGNSSTTPSSASVTSSTSTTISNSSTTSVGDLDSTTKPITTLMTTTTSGPSSTTLPMQRTVILMEKPTRDGEDLFIRGGLDHQTHPDCIKEAGLSACSIPIHDRLVGVGPHYAKYNAWSQNDNYLDWYGAEPGQGMYQGQAASGTPAVWTTSDQNRNGYHQFNTYGDHYWMLDVDIDCSKTENGWFQIKGFINGQWETNIPVTTCTGSDSVGIPANLDTGNHWAKCGMLNIYHYSKAECEIEPIP